MHFTHAYKWKFDQIAAAFLRKYNQKSRYSTVTICHVEQLDEDRFAFVRRIENTMSATLYERIVVDRRQQSLKGYTFESPNTDVYSEQYTYQSNPESPNPMTQYDMYMYKDPGWKRHIRG